MDDFNIQDIWVNSGVNYTLMGDYEAARKIFLASLELSMEKGIPVSQGMDHINLAWVYSAEGQWAKSKDHGLKALQLVKEVGFWEAYAECLTWLGHAWIGLGQPKRSRSAYQEARKLRFRLGQSGRAMEAIAGVALADQALEEMGSALQNVDEILEFFDSGGEVMTSWEPLRVYLACVQVLDEAGDSRLIKTLEEGYQFLQKRATRITDPEDRRCYLDSVPWHKEIVTRWEARNR
jgi:tetratricopeptide (TPR) repeat protein